MSFTSREELQRIAIGLILLSKYNVGFVEFEEGAIVIRVYDAVKDEDVNSLQSFGWSIYPKTATYAMKRK